MTDDQAWVDNQGHVWRLGEDGLMHSFETAPFPRECVEKKWGPLRSCSIPERSAMPGDPIPPLPPCAYPPEAIPLPCELED